MLGPGAWLTVRGAGWHAYSTGIGGFEHIHLSDGSSVRLNTNSELRVHLTSSRRQIRLVRGEALIQVARDERRPFELDVSDTTVHSVGATFDVRLRAAERVDILVTDERLAIGSTADRLRIGFWWGLSPGRRLLAGDTAIIQPGSLRVATSAPDDVSRKLAWTVGMLSFKGETLVEVTAEFNRYNRRIGGAFQATDPDSFIAALAKGMGIRAASFNEEGSDDGIVRLSRAQARR
jgi:transmembrane sensor